MRDDEQTPRFDPRSPVQPGRSPAPYILLAIVAALGIWTWQQQDIGEPTGQSINSNATPASPIRSQPASAKGDLRSVFTADDYPSDALQNSEEGTVRARLDVDTAGLVMKCTIVQSSGHRSLDDATCKVIAERARFTPARDDSGTAVPDSVDTPPVTWRLEG